MEQNPVIDPDLVIDPNVLKTLTRISKVCIIPQLLVQILFVMFLINRGYGSFAIWSMFLISVIVVIISVGILINKYINKSQKERPFLGYSLATLVLSTMIISSMLTSIQMISALVFTEKNSREINDICDKEKDINNLKVILANEATKILHGEIASKKAAQTAKETFEGNGLGLDLPEIKIRPSEIKNGVNLLDFLSKNKILSSKSEARRAIVNKGLKINNVVVVDENRILLTKDFKESGIL